MAVATVVTVSAAGAPRRRAAENCRLNCLHCSSSCGEITKSSYVAPSFFCGYQSKVCFCILGLRTFGCRQLESGSFVCRLVRRLYYGTRQHKGA